MIGRVERAIIEQALSLAKHLASEAAGLSRAGLGRTSVERKADASYVTEVDREIQARITDSVRRQFPNHAIIGEERVERSYKQDLRAAHEAEYCWIVDPLDGTRNYVAGLPIFATSIAILERGRPIIGVVLEHNLGLFYSAVLGAGALLNDQPIQASDPPVDYDLVLGVPSSKDLRSVNVIRSWTGRKGFICRNLGSTAIHLAMVASGVLNGACAKRCKIWDIAAGWLIVLEAGGKITDMDGNDRLPFALDGDPNTDTPFLAASPGVHRRLLETIRESAT